MRIVELTGQQFDDFASRSNLNNFYQTSKYAILMSNHGFNYDLIGYVDETQNNKIVAASVILNKNIKGSIKYGYAPKGFLIDYFNTSILEGFLRAIKDFYKKKGYIFIKFNPEIIIGKVDTLNKNNITYNANVRIIDTLKGFGVKRRVEQTEFELMQPKYCSYLNLKEFDFKKINRNYRKKIRHGISEGMSLVLGDAKQIDILYDFVKNKTDKTAAYYKDLFNVFNKDNSIDLLFVKIDYQKYLEYVRDEYTKEEQLNYKWNDIIARNPKKSNITAKMNSDNKLQGYKDKIIKATEGLKAHPEAIIAGALVIKHHSIITIVESGFGDEYRELNPNHFLYYAIFERYKPYFTYCNIGGISSFEENARFKGLNDYRLKWKPQVFEFIGEFDLVCSEYTFKKLIKTNYIENEFSKVPLAQREEKK